MSSTLTIIQNLKNSKQDFEWYPTTDEMLFVIKHHIESIYKGNRDYSVLDCGAGDGRSLVALSCGGAKFSIEKSPILTNLQVKEIIPIGTDFFHSTLIDKKVDIIFSNPPYSEFETWAIKTIREANANDIYLIIPERWKNSQKIKQALEKRKAKCEVIFSGDFLSAERQARANIDIVFIDLCNSRRQFRNASVDPFNVWFDETFPKKPNDECDDKTSFKQKVSNQLVSGANLIETLVEMYNHEMQNLHSNYQNICSLDSDLMEELGIKHHELAVAVKEKIKGLKNKYWNEFFNNYDSITDKLTTSSRDKMLHKLQNNMSVDFTIENAYVITLWVIKNANSYYDSQLIDLVEIMTRQANVKLYKSNQRVYSDEDWRYSSWSRSQKTPDDFSHYQLDYRIVLEHMGGISTSDWSWDRERNNGLSNTSADFIRDILAVCASLGHVTQDNVGSCGLLKRNWMSNKLERFTTQSGILLFDVRAFKNGNLHIRFDTGIMKKLNIEFGRLKGWLKDKRNVVDEMDVTVEEAELYFNSSIRLTSNHAQLLLTH